MFESVTTPLKVEARDLANFLIIAVALGLSAMIAFGSLLLAAGSLLYAVTK